MLAAMVFRARMDLDNEPQAFTVVHIPDGVGVRSWKQPNFSIGDASTWVEPSSDTRLDAP